MNAHEAAKLAAQLQGHLECYCPKDCNCRFQEPPWHRFNYCGCKAHGETSHGA